MKEIKVVLHQGARVELVRNKARVWLDDTGEIDLLPAGTQGLVKEQITNSLAVVDFPDTRWAGRPVKVKVSELREVN